jgi:transcription initiation factor TFIID TATA-box-binding protein
MRLTNVVCTADLGCSIDLRELTLQIANARYDPSKFSGLIWQHRRIGGNCLLFSNGKINCNGKCDSFKDGRERLRKYARLVQKLGWNVRLQNLTCATASAVHELSSTIKLESIPIGSGFSYEPELFPAIMARRDGVHFTCHFSGKIIITGIKRPRDICEIVYPMLLELEMYA